MQKLRLAARLVNASPSLMALLQSDAGRAWKAELFCDIELQRQEKGPQLVEVEGLSVFEKLWCEFPKSCGWCLRASGSSWNVVSGRSLRRMLSFPVLPTFSCDECDAVYKKLWALRSHQMRAHQRRREARLCVLGSDCGRDRGSFSIWRWERSGAFWHRNVERSSPFRMTRWQLPTSRTARTGDSVSGKDEVIWRGRHC